jgi:aarF domain-containing kinase
VFGKMMFQQLDLRHEAENLLTFEKNFASRKVPVTFPRPLVSWSATELLVEEYENALPLEAFLKNGGGPFEDQVATVGLDAFLASLSVSFCQLHLIFRTFRTCSSSTTLCTQICTPATS